MSVYLAIFGKPRYLGLVNIETEERRSSWVLLKTMRGLEMGLLGGALSPEQEEKYRRVGNYDGEESNLHGSEPMLQEVAFVSAAGESDITAANQNHIDEDAALLRSRVLLAGHKLPIKLVEVEYLFDKRKLFFYFTADNRVDFRAYVRDLAREFRTRIEMRQIGVRDEARSAKGISQCGRPCCCGYWLHQFTPICIRMVKEQNLALNPAKISGLCGRLMCCMSFEYDMYEEIWKKLPNPGSKLKTPNGNYVLDGIDLKNESVLVRYPEGKEVAIPVADFEKFREAVTAGEPWDAPSEPRASKVQLARMKKDKEKDEERPDPRAKHARFTHKQEKISLDEHLSAVKDINNKRNTDLKRGFVKRAAPEPKPELKKEIKIQPEKIDRAERAEKNRAAERNTAKPPRKKFHKPVGSPVSPDKAENKG